MWKLYKAGNEAFLRCEGNTYPCLAWHFDDHVFTATVDTDQGRETVHTPTQNVRIIESGVVNLDGQEYFMYLKEDEGRTPNEVNIILAALIADLNHHSGYFPMEFTPVSQRFSYEVKGDMGSRKLNHDRD